MSEAELLRRVLGLCDEHRVLAFHDHDARKNVPGFPDIVLVGQHGVAWAELKTEYGRMSREQTIWQYRLRAAGQRHYLWRPSDLESGDIESTLKNL